MSPSDKAGHNVFLSWSGGLSHAIAGALRDWLPNVVRDAKPWMSSEDIAKGKVWTTEISGRLATCNVGIIVLTQENLTKPWILFEAGALYKAMADRYVCTFLCDLEPPLLEPIGMFQATKLNLKDCRKLARGIDGALGGGSSDRLDNWFDKFWPDFEQQAKEAKQRHKSGSAMVRKGPTQEEMLVEVLGAVRAIREGFREAQSATVLQGNAGVFRLPQITRDSHFLISDAIAQLDIPIVISAKASRAIDTLSREELRGLFIDVRRTYLDLMRGPTRPSTFIVELPKWAVFVAVSSPGLIIEDMAPTVTGDGV